MGCRRDWELRGYQEMRRDEVRGVKRDGIAIMLEALRTVETG